MKPDYRKIHQMEVELGITPDQPYGWSLLQEASNMEELIQAWSNIKNEYAEED